MSKATVGLIGLGTMGAALALNIAEKGHRIAVWNRTTATTTAFMAEAGDLAERLVPTTTLQELVAAIAEPRVIILMVPAGPAVDQQWDALKPLLGPDDLVVDAGNANFHDTNRRVAAVGANGPRFFGIGVSGGEEGARHGPSIMGGGAKADWERIAPLLKSIAARYGDTPCADYMGEAGAGHFVKSVHNGIEYADMQMIAEVYGLLGNGLGLDAAAVSDVFGRWNKGRLQSYLIEITANIARTEDPKTGKPLVDMILDKAGQKGTGRWTVIEAQHLGAPVPVIEAAVAARNISARLDGRKRGEAAFGRPGKAFSGDAPDLADLERALITGKILCYAQGFDLISAAGEAFGWALPLADIARVWREGCIIRSAMLNEMASAFERSPKDNLIFDSVFAALLKEGEASLRKVVVAATSHGLPVPALSAGLAWFDMVRSTRSTANMIQAQRDYFGAHGFERTDDPTPGQHGNWVRG